MRTFWFFNGATFGVLVGTLIQIFVFATPACAAEPMVITNDYGGYPEKYIAWTKAKLTMRIEGECHSACTIYLGNPNACFDRHAVLYFHASSLEYANGSVAQTREPTADEWYATEYYVMPYYSPKVKRWIKRHGGLKVTNVDMLKLWGPELHSMARICSN